MLRPSTVAAAVAMLVSMASPLFGQTARPADAAVRLSGYAQLQYDLVSRDADAIDRVFLRRVMVALDATPAPHWTARIQVDLGPLSTGDAVVLKDAYLRYTGLEAHGLTLTIGNQKSPFSRSLYLSSSRRGLLERPFTGDRGLGSPGRALAIKLDGRAAGDRVQWSGSIGSALHAPNAASLRIDGIAEAGPAWNDGIIGVGRIEFHPLGAATRDWGAFGGPNRILLAAAAYTWHNDGDRNLYTVDRRTTDPLFADLQRAGGVEVSAGWRGARLSVDSEYHHVAASAVDDTFTGGIYDRGRAALHEWSVEAGVMIVPGTIELLGGLDALDIAARDVSATHRSVGANWYIVGHTVKLSIMERWTSNDNGVRGLGLRATYAQAQVAF